MLRGMKKSTCFAVYLVATALVVIIALAWPSFPTRLISVHFADGRLEVNLNSDAEFSYAILADVPSSIDATALESLSLKPSKEGSIVLPAPEPANREYSIIVIKGKDWFELVRQPEAWLRAKFRFEQRGGYTVLGRRTINIDTESTYSPRPLVLSHTPRLQIGQVDSFPYPAIGIAVALLEFLWEKPVMQGPTTLSYREFVKQPLTEKLRAVQEGRFSVQCAGFRELFVHAATGIKGLKVRPVDAYGSDPQLPGLTSYSHAATEIWVEQLNKWVLFDPWNGIFVERDGIPVSANEMSTYGADQLSIVPVMESIPRFHVDAHGQTQKVDYDPNSLSLTSFTCVDAGCQPGYQLYFKIIRLRDVHL